MDLTPENKETIDAKSYEALLDSWRYSSSGDPWFQGETGKYWTKRMAEKKEQHSDPVSVSKALG